ncbi:MAG TPA: hypothetical protein VK154_03190 [Chitinophagales bacterium]|nr:hypothetical protein [Chitinophagales bacterium]
MKAFKTPAAAIALLLLATVAILLATLPTNGNYLRTQHATTNPATTAATDTPTPEKGCVFKTVFGEEPSDSDFIYKTPQKVAKSQQEALAWLAKAQGNDGGWGAGSHSRQGVMDPHAVKSDPATTAMVAMGLLRCRNTPTSGEYSANLTRALNYMLAQVENSPEKDLNITTLQGTQPQVKLGANIDVVLTSQFLTNIVDYVNHDPQLKKRVEKCLNKCVAKIQRGQDTNGSFKGSGWAGVLQSSLANNALETAQMKGATVDSVVLEQSRTYQKSNVAANGSVNTDMGAGVVLYSVSSATRASAKEARVAKEKVEVAKKEGKLNKDDKVTADNLRKIGFSDAQAMKYGTAYDVNETAKTQSISNDVMDGFGSNGGEEFLSYLQTGEGMIMGKDREWKKWYDNMNGRLLKIQNNDGSWQGHHCITSPVFCTATCLLILSVNNDIEQLVAMGK